jgi:hypothetical protein
MSQIETTRTLDEQLAQLPNVDQLLLGAPPDASGHAWDCMLITFTRNPRANVSVTTTRLGHGATVEEAIDSAPDTEETTMDIATPHRTRTQGRVDMLTSLIETLEKTRLSWEAALEGTIAIGDDPEGIVYLRAGIREVQRRIDTMTYSRARLEHGKDDPCRLVS